MLAAYAKDDQLRLLLRPDLEDLTGWTAIELPADYAPDLYRVEGGALVLYLTQRKQAAWQGIKAEREARAKTAATAHGVFDCDETGRSNLLGQLQAFALLGDAVPVPISWKLHDNSFVDLTREEFTTACLQVFGHIREVYATSFALEGAIDSAATAEAVDAVAWPTP